MGQILDIHPAPFDPVADQGRENAARIAEQANEIARLTKAVQSMSEELVRLGRIIDRRGV